MTELTFNLPEKGEARSAADVKIREALSKTKEATNELFGIQHPVKWYEPKIIEAEQLRESTVFGTLGTPDEISGVVVPSGGLLLVAYVAAFASTVSGAGRAAIFVGSEQLKVKGEAQEESCAGTTLNQLTTTAGGLYAPGAGANISAPEAIATGREHGGFCVIRASAGTYAVSVKYRATSGSVKSESRHLYVAVLGA